MAEIRIGGRAHCASCVMCIERHWLTCRWMSVAAEALGKQVLASTNKNTYDYCPILHHSVVYWHGNNKYLIVSKISTASSLPSWQQTTQMDISNAQYTVNYLASLGPFHGAIAVPSVTRCSCRRHCHGHRTPPAL